ncbi:MAG TPA: peptidoglycan DD-metalloendopeptidase family protein [bacterium]|nr:peptidoglycan DD-metalloendopeptidase family protein [bacterium]HPT29446.1 peptidoglycan DD-metalloendopeptidase family protein [bacterium]
MSKAPNLTKQILINTLIPFLKILIFLKKVITTFFLLLVFKPLKWLISTLLYRPTIKIYGTYLLNLKRLRAVGLKHNPRLFLIKKFSVPIIITLIFLAVVLNNLISSPNFGELANRMHKSIAASLVKNEFDTGTTEELITETMDMSAICSSTPAKYQSTNSILKPQPKITTNTTPTDSGKAALCLVRNNDTLIRPDILTTGSSVVTAPERRSIVEYTVKAGDTISTIARQFGVTVNTILWANSLSANSTIRQGDKLNIPPVTGVVHKVASGETIRAIANKYGVSADTIIASNGLDDSGKLRIGQSLIIPGGQKTATATRTTTTYRAVDIVKDIVKPSNAKPQGGKMQWPTVGYRITQYYSWRHTGLDIANKTGTPLYAAESGTVEKAGWNSGGYGNMVLVNHGGGIKTRYAHLSKIYVQPGESVERGQVVGLMGSTGRSTGPHIHFEVIVNGRNLNPLNYIK